MSSLVLFIVISLSLFFFFFFNDTATTEIYTLSLHDALPIEAEHALVASRSPHRLTPRQHRFVFSIILSLHAIHSAVSVQSLASSDRGLLVFLLCDASAPSASLRYILFFLPIERRPLTRSRDVRKGFRRIHGRRPSHNLHQPAIIQAVSVGVASPQVEPHLLSQSPCRTRLRFPEQGLVQYPSRPLAVPFFQ